MGKTTIADGLVADIQGHLEACDDAAPALSGGDFDAGEHIGHVRAAGQLLMQARQNVPGDEWLSWLGKHGIDVDAAGLVMRIEAAITDTSGLMAERMRASWDALPDDIKAKFDTPELKLFAAIVSADDSEH